MIRSEKGLAIQLQRRVRCPHCWTEFPPHEVRWISSHSDLRGDPLLGQDEQRRFLPTRFNVEGKALDVRGVPCKHLACPHCHLFLPWSLLEMKPLFISILGAPGSGKSFFLAAMIWQLRKTLPGKFSVDFSDADPVSNQVISGYEETLFLNPRDDELVTLAKTEQEGQLYQSVRHGTREVWYPKPFVYQVKPVEGHPSHDRSKAVSRALCLYDNAGEHFLPGGETARSPAKHMALSEVLLFLFDPTQHPQFRRACRKKSEDPQMGKHGWSHRQDQVLLEAASRVRSHNRCPAHVKYPNPLLVVVTKYDAWCSLLGGKRPEIDQLVRPVSTKLSALDVQYLSSVSDSVRAVVVQYAPEVVAAAEGFSEQVMFIPVSALGRAPTLDETTNALGVRPADIRPMWAEVPMLYALYISTKSLVRTAVRKQAGGKPDLKIAREDETDTAATASGDTDWDDSPDVRETGS